MLIANNCRCKTRDLIGVFKSLFYCFFFILFIYSIQVNATSINIVHSFSVEKSKIESDQNITLRYLLPPRFARVVTDGKAQLDIQIKADKSKEQSFNGVFWSAAGLFDSSKTGAILSDKQVLVTLLNRLANSQTDLDGFNVFSSDIEQLNRSVFASRIWLDVNYDAARIGPPNNPLLDGNFLLYLPPRPQYISVFGATTGDNDIRWQPGIRLSDIINTAKPHTKLADRSYATVISPNGQQKKVGIAYWNKQELFLAPGSAVYFNYRNISENAEHLNSTFLTLLSNRVPL
ncbi:capsule biosynthesis GfcC family protein [Veronia pacifica]|uniref:Uncharacterized protein n=1 Tax=Veronia pacifica TaxID=1080227 RepID=A0A1C3ER91_9GAMM|nr:capsule biosynthesis GfcC family protein [Veronia pacifica]ODA35757.1 hypothetical protein A8L45_01580 [Veronia pacifica]